MAELAIKGGTPVRPQGYPAWPVWDEREIEAVTAVVRSGGWGGFPEPGVNASKFEGAFAAYQGARHGILMVNGTITMEVALKALGIGWGDEVIIPALTFAATAYAPMAAGALPVIVDITSTTWTIDPDLVEAAITPRTKAIMPVHLGHHMADMDRIVEIARKHSLAIVEDCAHAHGQQWKGQGAGCIGDFGSFSHQSSKILTAGEGGSLLTSDERLARLAHSIIDCGRPKDPEEKEYTFGANYRLGELHASLLVVAMGRFEDQRREREENGRYLEELAPQVPGVHVMKADERITRWSFYNYLLRIDPEEFGAANELVCDALEAEGVPGELQYPPMSHYDLFQPSLSRLPVAVEFADRFDPSKMSFPVAEAAGLRESIYFQENLFRAGRQGIEDAVEALAKIQKNAHELAA
jgi:dTDP-4-amino-4,6-dideoxygalactose transaminase